MRARWLGHRLYAEMTLTVDPALSLADAHKVDEDVKKHARGHLPALDSLRVEVVPASGRKRPKHRPEAEREHHH